MNLVKNTRSAGIARQSICNPAIARNQHGLVGDTHPTLLKGLEKLMKGITAIIVGLGAINYSQKAKADQAVAYIRTIPQHTTWIADGITEYKVDVVGDTTHTQEEFTAAQWGVMIPAPIRLEDYVRAELPDEINNPSQNPDDFFYNHLMNGNPGTQPYNWIHSLPVSSSSQTWPLKIEENVRITMSPFTGPAGNYNKIFGSYFFTVSPSANPGTYNFQISSASSGLPLKLLGVNQVYQVTHCSNGNGGCLVTDPQPFLIIPVGDMNMDTLVNTEDVQPFVNAIMDPETYYTQRQNNEVGSADMNLDGVVDGRDIQLFVNKLLE